MHWTHFTQTALVSLRSRNKMVHSAYRTEFLKNIALATETKKELNS